MIANIIRIVTLVVLVTCLSGCASMAWKNTTSADTVGAYERFLQQYPQSEFASRARQKLEALYYDNAKGAGTIRELETFLRRYPQSRFSAEARDRLQVLYYEEAKVTGTIQGFEDFLKKYQNGVFSAEATKKMDGLKQEIRQMEEAARKVLPQGAKGEVTTVSQYPKNPEFVIAAHLLEGHSADESSPYVRGDYGTHEKLTRLVQFRCAKILKSVAIDALPSSEAEIVISGRHGVRKSYIGQAFSGTDVAMTIYEITIPVADIKKNDMGKMDEEAIMKLWNVRNNIIPSLSFKTQWGGFR